MVVMVKIVLNEDIFNCLCACVFASRSINFFSLSLSLFDR